MPGLRGHMPSGPSAPYDINKEQQHAQLTDSLSGIQRRVESTKQQLKQCQENLAIVKNTVDVMQSNNNHLRDSLALHEP